MAAIVMASTAAVTVVIAGMLTPGYDPVARTISRLASPGMPYAGAVGLAIVLVALSCIALAAALTYQSIRLRAALVVAAGALLVAAAIHLDPASATATAIHRLASAVAALSLAVSPALMRRPYPRFSVIVGAIEAALLVAAPFLLATPFNAWGAWERALLALALAWLVVVAATMRSAEDTVSATSAALSSTGS
ncbi:MAG TPA: DUF998 domain-containing protein [Candidatus Limnocylindrales bacterium]|nr:DUF998 domain-containing protein [Candidatus Limnocylindrales bacterium]